MHYKHNLQSNLKKKNKNKKQRRKGKKVIITLSTKTGSTQNKTSNSIWVKWKK